MEDGDRAVGLVMSYGRVELCELLAMWSRQTVAIPLLVYLDGVTAPTRNLPAGVFVHRAPRLDGQVCIGAARAASVELARERFELGPRDAIVVLDDDDYYHSRHVEFTLQALTGHDWTGSLRMGLQLGRGEVPRLLVSEHGPGQHATWAMRLATYDQGGGYRAADKMEDAQLAARLGWDRCASHRLLTHVRRHHAHNLSASGFDTDRIRAAPLADVIEPIWSQELDTLAAWSGARLYG